MKNILIVGCGATGAICASLLRNVFPQKSLNIAIWEKANGAGKLKFQRNHTMD